MKHVKKYSSTTLLAALALLISACGGGSNPESGSNAGGSNAGSDGGNGSNGGAIETRAGTIFGVTIQSPSADGEDVVFTVFEPRNLVAGQTHPLVLEGHGFSGDRQTDEGGGGLGGFPIARLLDEGYGVISIAQRGHGESGGTIRVMDPDAEGINLVAILDWAEDNLPWLRYGPDDDFAQDNLVVGAVGSSYGGGYQMILNAVDPMKRLDAIVPQITWNDLTYSLNPGLVIKAGWVGVLFGAGNTAGDGNNFDPFVIDTLNRGLQNNQIDQEGQDFFRYHGQGYFCGTETVMTNGGAGTSPNLAPAAPGHIDAMFFQGFRDTLFTFNDAWRNYECLRTRGGDVRLLTYQSGHNTLQAVPDPGNAQHQPTGNELISDCGDLNVVDAAIAFFAEHLKGEAGAANAVIPQQVCLSTSGNNAVLVDSVPVGGTSANFDPVSVTLGALNTPFATATLYTAPAGGSVIAGVPTAQITIDDSLVTSGEPIVFIGVGHIRAGSQTPDLVDNQILPIRGAGDKTVELVGVAEELAEGESLVLVFYGGHDQYHATGNINPSNPAVGAVSISGSAQLPIIPTQSQNQ